MANPKELPAVVAQLRNELTEIQKTLSFEFAFTEAEHQGALSRCRRTYSQSRG